MKTYAAMLATVLFSLTAQARNANECRFEYTDNAKRTVTGVMKFKRSTFSTNDFLSGKIAAELYFGNETVGQQLGNAALHVLPREEVRKVEEIVASMKYLRINTTDLNQVKAFVFASDTYYFEAYNSTYRLTSRFALLGGVMPVLCK